MSVHSGFVTRSQENTYNHAVYNLLCLLQLKVAKTLKGGMAEQGVENFDDAVLEKYFARFYCKVAGLDECKHAAPLFSQAVKHLAQHFKLTKENAILEEPGDESGFMSSTFSLRRLYPRPVFNSYNSATRRDIPRNPEASPIPERPKRQSPERKVFKYKNRKVIYRQA